MLWAVKSPRQNSSHVVFNVVEGLCSEYSTGSSRMVRGGKVSPLAHKMDDFKLVE